MRGHQAKALRRTAAKANELLGRSASLARLLSYSKLKRRFKATPGPQREAFQRSVLHAVYKVTV
jgi:hypothetical protein